MRRARLRWLVGALAFYLVNALSAGVALGADSTKELMSGVVGMYVHQHWPYGHPYSARTWSIDEWRGYAGGLRALGYNTILIWPMLEMMPFPLTESDRESLAKHSRVIDMLKTDLGMRVGVVLAPNVVATERAKDSTFENRHFYWTTRRVDPRDPVAMRQMMSLRKQLLSHLASADALVIIDGDPGGYAGSSNAEFVSLLQLHRRMLDDLRRGIEIDYWAWKGWEVTSDFYRTGAERLGTEREFADLLSRMSSASLEPWGIAPGKVGLLRLAEAFGAAPRAISFSYGGIELEPSVPLTMFGGAGARDAGARKGMRGVVGNAQTHCVQLPNTYAFARGALGKNTSEKDYKDFAERLIRGHGELIVRSWSELAGNNPKEMRDGIQEIRNAAAGNLELGDLRGLLFGDGKRFLNDLILQLELRAAYLELIDSPRQSSEVRRRLPPFLVAAEAWQQRTGYKGLWWQWPGLWATLRAAESPQIDSVLGIWKGVCSAGLDGPGEGAEDSPPKCSDARGTTSAYAVDVLQSQWEDFTPRLLKAIRSSLGAARN